MCLSRLKAFRGVGAAAFSTGLADILREHVAPAILAAASTEQLSHVRGAAYPPLLQQTIGANLEQTVRAHPDRPALISLHQGLRYTYRQLGEEVDQVARGLLALGVGHADRVGIWAPNCAEWTLLQYAATKVGAILVNLNPANRGAELAHALRAAGVSTLVLAPELKGSSLVDILGSVVAAGGAPALRHTVVLGGEDVPEGFLSWDDLRWEGEGWGLGAALQRRQAELRPEDPINIQFTSGTTGSPKAATLSHRNILNNGYLVGQGCRYSEQDRVCIPVPLYHCFGMVMGNLACTTHGAAMVYPSDCFDPEATLRAVEEEGCTSLYGVPTMFIAQLEHPNFRRYRLDSLRTGIMAGSPCPVEVMKRVRTEMHAEKVTCCYGMTETSPVSFQTSVQDRVERQVSTVGRVHPHLEAKVVNPETREALPRGAVGELCVRGYSVIAGYWRDPAATAWMDEERWMHTGDLAILDGEGYCRIVGRIKDMVIRGGENVYPREVEEFLHRHPGVADVQVFGVPDPRYGEELCAWVRLTEGHRHLSCEELREWCRGRIAHFKIPRYWKAVESYPQTVSGKCQKYKMREQSVQELGMQEVLST